MNYRCYRFGLGLALAQFLFAAQSNAQSPATNTTGTNTSGTKTTGTNATGANTNGTNTNGTNTSGTNTSGTNTTGTNTTGTNTTGTNTTEGEDEVDCDAPEFSTDDLEMAYAAFRSGNEQAPVAGAAAGSQPKKKRSSFLPKDPIVETKLDSSFHRKFYLVIGPDGAARGVTPSAIREDSEIYVIAYDSPGEVPMNISASGCERLQTRVLGSAAAVAFDATKKVRARIYSLGRCNADSQVNIQIERQLISNGEKKKCTAKQVVFKTAPVYHLTVGYGAAYLSGTTTTAGVDLSAGGMPSTAFERESERGLQDRVLLGWFPLGYSPDTRITDGWREALEKVFVGTTIDPEHALSSFNTVLGISPTTGLALFGGAEWCRRQEHLSGGLTNGAIYTDDSSTLPTTDSWTCKREDIAGIVGVSVTADILGKLFK